MREETMGLLRLHECAGFHPAEGICSGFFLRYGLTPESIDSIRGAIVAISLRTRTSIQFLYELPIDELNKVAREILGTLNTNKRE